MHCNNTEYNKWYFCFTTLGKNITIRSNLSHIVARIRSSSWCGRHGLYCVKLEMSKIYSRRLSESKCISVRAANSTTRRVTVINSWPTFSPYLTIECAVGKRLITHCCVSRLACSRLSGHIEPHSPRLQAWNQHNYDGHELCWWHHCLLEYTRYARASHSRQWCYYNVAL